jgi:sulfofructose kinase
MRFDVVGIDSPCVDLALNLDKFPGPNDSEKVQDYSWQGGGKVATGMIAAARLGAKGAIIGQVGDDKYGRFCVDDFKSHHIDTAYLLERNGKTTNFDIVVSNKKTMERCILYHPGNAEPMSVDELPLSYLKNTKYFYISRVDDITSYASKTAREGGAQVVIDADSFSEELNNFLGNIDVLIGSEFAYEGFFKGKGDLEENCSLLRQQGPKIVIFTFGEKGCVGLDDDGYFELPSYLVKAVDTVGAGDVFHGAFIAGLLHGMNTRDSARFASAVSAIKCTKIGGRAGIPDFDMTIKFMEKGKIDERGLEERVRYYQKRIENV